MTELIAVAGDWHADYDWAAASIRTLAKRGITKVLHVGDFGVGFGSSMVYVDPVEALLARHNITIYVTPGNHENYDIIETSPVLDEHNGMPAGLIKLTPHILLMPRGYRWEWEGVRYVSLGGGNSIDKTNRVAHVSWWPQETITLGDVMRTTEPGEADVMIAHVAPFAARYVLDPMGWGHAAATYSNESRLMMGYVVDDVHPKLYVHGHYHTDKVQQVTQRGSNDKPYTTVYASMGMNKHQNNLAILNPATRWLDFIEKPDGVTLERRDERA